MLEFTSRNGMKGMPNGMREFVIPGKRKTASQNAQQAIIQRAVCATCRGGCQSHQAKGVPIGMNYGRSLAEK